jgi:hypothetical protein
VAHHSLGEGDGATHGEGQQGGEEQEGIHGGS